jgi:hypothetical protein
LHRLDAEKETEVIIGLAVTWHVTANQALPPPSKQQFDFHQDTPPNVLACDHD